MAYLCAGCGKELGAFERYRTFPNTEKDIVICLKCDARKEQLTGEIFESIIDLDTPAMLMLAEKIIETAEDEDALTESAHEINAHQQANLLLDMLEEGKNNG